VIWNVLQIAVLYRPLKALWQARVLLAASAVLAVLWLAEAISLVH
jgi:hypothetical protein